MSARQTTLVLLFALLHPFSVSAAEGKTRHQVDPASSLVSFTSKAPLEDFSGKTRKIEGWAEVDPGHLKSTQALVSIDLNNLKTGNRLRDKQMRTRFLETDKFPVMSFHLKKILSGPSFLPPEGEVELKAMGEFDLHGTKRGETVMLRVAYNRETEKILVKSSFPLKLADYQIKRPKFLFFRLAEMVEISVNLEFN